MHAFEGVTSFFKWSCDTAPPDDNSTVCKSPLDRRKQSNVSTEYLAVVWCSLWPVFRFNKLKRVSLTFCRTYSCPLLTVTKIRVSLNSCKHNNFSTSPSLRNCYCICLIHWITNLPNILTSLIQDTFQSLTKTFPTITYTVVRLLYCINVHIQDVLVELRC